MLQEALKYLVEVGQERKPDIVKCDAEPSHIYYLRQPDGTIAKKFSEKPPENHKLRDMNSIVAIYLKYESNLLAGSLDDSPEIWIDAGQIVLRIGYNLRGRASLPLAYSEPFVALVAFRQNKSPCTQADLIRLLRVTFKDSLSHGTELVEAIRRVKFVSGQTINSEIGHGKASLGKEILGEVTGSKAIPEYITFNVPVYANGDLQIIRHPVQCALEPDPSTGTFRVIPLPGQIDAAIDAATNYIRSHIAAAVGDGAAIYIGTP